MCCIALEIDLGPRGSKSRKNEYFPDIDEIMILMGIVQFISGWFLHLFAKLQSAATPRCPWLDISALRGDRCGQTPPPCYIVTLTWNFNPSSPTEEKDCRRWPGNRPLVTSLLLALPQHGPCSVPNSIRAPFQSHKHHRWRATLCSKLWREWWRWWGASWPFANIAQRVFVAGDRSYAAGATSGSNYPRLAIWRHPRFIMFCFYAKK